MSERDHVIRYVLTYLNRDNNRVLFGARQGRDTYATKLEAVSALGATFANNSKDTLRPYRRLEVRPCKCYPNHFDPQEMYFDLNAADIKFLLNDAKETGRVLYAILPDHKPMRVCVSSVTVKNGFTKLRIEGGDYTLSMGELVLFEIDKEK